MLDGLAVSVLWLAPPASLCVLIPGRPVPSGSNLGMESCGTGSALKVQRETSRILFLAVSWILFLDGSGWVPLGPGI